MNSILLLGTGPGSAVSGRACTSVVLRLGGSCVLVDAGEPCSLRLHERGIAFSSLDAVFLTHGHSDHTGGFPMLVQGAWLEPRKRRLPVYLPAELIAPLRAWLEAVYLPPNLLGFDLDFRPWVADAEFHVAGKLLVTPYPTHHLDGLRQIIKPDASDRFMTFSLAVEGGGARVVFSSDLGAPDDLQAQLETPCDLLVCELSHFAPEELFAFLRGRPVARLVLTHLAPDLAGREDELQAAAAEALPQAQLVAVAKDGDEFVF